MNTYRFRSGRTVRDLGDGYRIQTHTLPDGAPLAVAYRAPGGPTATFEGATVEEAISLARQHLSAMISQQPHRIDPVSSRSFQLGQEDGREAEI